MLHNREEQLVENETQETPAYEQPTVVDYGDIRELTASQTTGGHFDHTFVAGQPATPPFS
jgi:hypothetical protein